MSNIKYKKFNKILVIVAVIAVLCTGFVFPVVMADGNNTNVSHASTSNIVALNSIIDEKNLRFTDTDFLTYPEGKSDSKLIQDYPTYVENRYPHGEELLANLPDEQIFNIIPQEVFIMLMNTPGEYSYIGLQYGYYVSRTAENNTFMVYIFDTNIRARDAGGSASATDFAKMSISLLYYEEYQYKYNSISNSGVASIMMTAEIRDEIHSGMGPGGSNTDEEFAFYAYEQYSKNNDMYMKDIAFAGNIFNKYHANIGQENYMPKEDDGLYMIGTTTKYSGVSNRTDGAWQPIQNLAGTALGLTPIGPILTIADSLSQVGKFFGNLIKEGDVITNENFTPTEIKDERTRDDQVDAYGHTLKNGRVGIYSDNSNPILFGMPNMIGGKLKPRYVENEFILTSNQAWEAEFIGSVSFELVSKDSRGDISEVAEIKSNNYSMDLNEGKESDVFVLEEGMPQEVNLAPNVTKAYAFTAPNSGNFEFEAYCNVDCIHTHSCNAMITLDLGSGNIENSVDKKVKVYLNKGEKIVVSTNIVEADEVASYNILAKYVNYQASVDGDVDSFNQVGNNDWSYIELDVFKTAGYNFTFSSTELIKVELFEASEINDGQPIFSADLKNSTRVSSNKLDHSLAEFLNKEKYIVKVTSYSPTTIDFKVSSAEELNFDEKYTNVGDNQTFLKTSIYSDTKLLIESNSSLLFEIYNEFGRELELTVSSGISEVFLASGEYYIKVIGSGEYKFIKEIESLYFGENQISTFHEEGEKMMTLYSPTDFVVSINYSSNLSIEIYDKYNVLISDLSNMDIVQSETYFVKIKLNSGINGVINIDVDGVVPDESETEQISGTICNNGYTVVEYTPSIKGYYNHFVSPKLNYEVYNQQINQLKDSVQFAYGQNYFIKIYGNSGEQFHLTFVNTENRVMIKDLNMVKNNEAYSFVVNQSSLFLFKGFRADFKIDIINFNGDIICSDLNIVGGANVELQVGKYLIIPNMANASDWLSINDKNITHDDNQLKLDTNATDVGLAAGDSKRLYYEADVTAIYYFEFSINITQDIFRVYYNVGNEMIYMDLVRDKNNPEIFVFELIQGTTYFFNIENYTDIIYDFDISLYRPGKIHTLVINNKVIYDESDENITTIELQFIIGETYSITADFFYYCTNTPLTIKTEFDNEVNDYFTIDSKNNITAIFNQDNLDTSLKPTFTVSTALSHFVIHVQLIAPYTVTSGISGNDLSMTINNVENVSVMLPIGSTITTGIELKRGSMVNNRVAEDFKFEMSFMEDSYQYSFKNDFQFTDAETGVAIYVKINCGKESFLEYELNNTLETMQFKGGTASYEENRVYINLGTTVNIFNVTLAKAVETVIITDVLSERVFSAFNFVINKGSNDILIYAEKLNWKIKTTNNYAITSERDNTKIKIDGDVMFSGEAKLSLIKAKNLSLSGEGSFNVIAETENLYTKTGNNGIAGISADSFTLYEDSNLNVKVQGGDGHYGKDGVDLDGGTRNGMDGENGGTGGTGGVPIVCASYYNYSDSVVHLVYGDGGHGGYGGDAAHGAHGAEGKSGAPGERGQDGGNGGAPGDGGSAVVCNTKFFKGVTVSAGATGPSGGIHGHGGDGGNGGNGASWRTGSAIISSDGGAGGNGGKGGGVYPTPGNGGNGGNGGKPDPYAISGKNGGNGGQGYNGGNGGDATKNVMLEHNHGKGGNGGLSHGGNYYIPSSAGYALYYSSGGKLTNGESFYQGLKGENKGFGSEVAYSK